MLQTSLSLDLSLSLSRALSRALSLVFYLLRDSPTQPKQLPARAHIFTLHDATRHDRYVQSRGGMRQDDRRQPLDPAWVRAYWRLLSLFAGIAQPPCAREFNRDNTALDITAASMTPVICLKIEQSFFTEHFQQQ